MEKILRGIKHTQQYLRHDLEHRHAHQHKGQGAEAGDLQGLGDPLRLSRTVVVGHDGDGGVIHSEQRHKEEALELEVNAEHIHRDLTVLGKALEDLVDAHIHNGANAVHNNSGNTHRQHRAHHIAPQLEIPQTEFHIGVEFQVEDDRQNGRHPLTGDRSHGSAGDAHLGERTDTKDQQRIQHDVDDRAHALGDHGVHGAAGSLEQPLRQHFHKNTQAQQADDRDILSAELHRQIHIGHHGEIGSHTNHAEHHEQRRGHKGQGHAVACGEIGLFLVSLAQGFAQQRIDAYADTHRKTDQDVLHSKSQAHGGNGAFPDHGLVGKILIFRNTGNKVAVHHIVKGLDQHGDHHGHGHIHQQLAHGHDAHFIPL